MYWTAWATLAALLMYIWVSMNVARARVRHGVPAPRTDGPLEFLSVVRVQANTVEQLLLFLPALWLCAYYLRDDWAALLGAAWVAGRVVYALAYYRDPAKRGPGFAIAFGSSILLLIGGALGLIERCLKTGLFGG